MLRVFDHCLWECKSGRQILWRTYCHITPLIFVCLLRFLLTLNFVFSKTKVNCFILFVIKQFSGSVTSDIDIYSVKASIIRRGEVSSGNLEGNIAYTFSKFQSDDVIKN